MELNQLPVVSRFLGILIVMYYEDHNPPHFHVRYTHLGEYFADHGYRTGGAVVFGRIAHFSYLYNPRTTVLLTFILITFIFLIC